MSKSLWIIIAVLAIAILGGTTLVGSNYPRIQEALWDLRAKAGLAGRSEPATLDTDNDGKIDVQRVRSKDGEVTLVDRDGDGKNEVYMRWDNEDRLVDYSSLKPARTVEFPVGGRKVWKHSFEGKNGKVYSMYTVDRTPLVTELDSDGDGRPDTVNFFNNFRASAEPAPEHANLIRAILTKSGAAGKPDPQNAQPEHAAGTRACAELDVLGTWDLAAFYAKGAKQEARTHERFTFYEGGRMRHISSSNPIDAADPATAAMMAMPATVEYKLYKNGILEVRQPDMPDRSFYSLCSLVEQKTAEAEKGDILLSIAGTDGKTEVFRVLKKAADGA